MGLKKPPLAPNYLYTAFRHILAKHRYTAGGFLNFTSKFHKLGVGKISYLQHTRRRHAIRLHIFLSLASLPRPQQNVGGFQDWMCFTIT